MRNTALTTHKVVNEGLLDLRDELEDYSECEDALEDRNIDDFVDQEEVFDRPASEARIRADDEFYFKLEE